MLGWQRNALSVVVVMLGVTEVEVRFLLGYLCFVLGNEWRWVVPVAYSVLPSMIYDKGVLSDFTICHWASHSCP